MKTFGKTVKALRLKNKIGLREMSRIIGVSGSYMAHVESGENEPPSLRTIDAMARVYGVKFEELLELSGKRKLEWLCVHLEPMNLSVKQLTNLIYEARRELK